MVECVVGLVQKAAGRIGKEVLFFLEMASESKKKEVTTEWDAQRTVSPYCVLSQLQMHLRVGVHKDLKGKDIHLKILSRH